MKFSVTLIHGTYAMGAAWTKPESKLCKYLKTQFGEDVEFDRFEWRAPNRHGARFEASRKLLDEHKTKKCLFRETGIPQFVIAHSHGGSVLAYALRDDADFAKALAGAAFLSTPFIQARERPTGLSLLKRLPFVIAFLAFLIAFFLSLIAYAELGYSGRLTTAAVWIWILFLGCVTLLSFFGARAWIDLPETGLPVKLEPAVQQILSELSLSGLSEEQLSEKTLILRANADEASSSLAAVHIVTRLLNEIPARIGRIPSTSFGFLMNKWDAKLRMQEKNPTRPFRVVVGCVFVGLMFKFFGIPLIRRLSGEGTADNLAAAFAYRLRFYCNFVSLVVHGNARALVTIIYGALRAFSFYHFGFWRRSAMLLITRCAIHGYLWAFGYNSPAVLFNCGTFRRNDATGRMVRKPTRSQRSPGAGCTYAFDELRDDGPANV